VRGGNPVIQPQTCSTPMALSPGASGSPAKRVVALRSATRPHSISIVKRVEIRGRPDRNPEPRRLEAVGHSVKNRHGNRRGAGRTAIDAGPQG